MGDWTNDFELISVASEPYETHSIFARNMSDFNEELATKIKELLCNGMHKKLYHINSFIPVLLFKFIPPHCFEFVLGS